MSGTQSDTTQSGGEKPPEKASRDERRTARDWRNRTGAGGDKAGAADEARILLGGIAVLAGITAAINYLDVLTDLHDAPQFGIIQPVIWEGTSWVSLVVAFLIPWAAQKYFPVGRPPLWRTLLVYAAAAPVFSLVHVAGFIALRMAIYSAFGGRYVFGPFVQNFGYEASRDILGYVGAISVFWSARRLVKDRRRNPAEEALFDIRDGARLIRVKFDDILALTSAGNYVEFVLRDGRRPLMRRPLSAMEVELGPRGFVRTHRSWLVNAMQVTGLKPEGSGDYEIEIGAVTVPLSRRFPDALAKLRAG